MNLLNFETYFDDVILERGRDYFIHGHVEKVNEKGENQYVVYVMGSGNYKVNVSLSETQEVLDSNCDCPYDWGDDCKHLAAALFALREALQLPVNDDEEPVDLEIILANLSKDELIRIVLDLSDEYDEVEKKLLFHYAPAEDEVVASQKLIKEYMHQSMSGGFIDWRSVDHALQGAELTLDKVRAKINTDEAESAVLLSILVLSNVVDMLQFCDDSSGSVGFVIHDSLTLIDEAVSTSIDHLDDQRQEIIFDFIMNEAMNDRYDGWSDWRIGLLKICIYFGGHATFRRKLENQLDELIENSTGSSWHVEYEKDNLNLLKLALLERYDGEEAVQAFINEHIQNSPFREKAIQRFMKKGDFLEVVNLCIEGEATDKQYPGLVRRWEKYRLQAYEGLGDITGQQELMHLFLLRDEFEYYAKLKKLYEPNEWEKVLKQLIKTFEKQSQLPSAYVDILIEENMKAKLLEYCKSHISSIRNLYPHLVDDYFAEVNQMFVEFIERNAGQARDRKAYKHVCSLIKIYKQACGDSPAYTLIDQLKQKYKRRPAFVDELGKLG